MIEIENSSVGRQGKIYKKKKQQEPFFPPDNFGGDIDVRPPSAHNFVSVRAQNLNILIFNFIFLHCIYLLHLFQMFIVKSTENNLKMPWKYTCY